MREARIILPVLDNNGQSLVHAHDYLKRQLCLLFGGYTATASYGGWIDQKTGKLYEEQGTAYDIACEHTQENRAVLVGLAQMLIELAQQKAIYLRLPNGNVQIVEPDLAEGVA